MARLAVIDEREIDPSADRMIRAALCDAFAKDKAHFSVTRGWHGSDPSYSVIAVQDDAGAGERVIAHAGIVDRTIRVGGEALRVAGVQNVCVIPTERGKGHSLPVMRRAMDEARDRGFDGGMLFCTESLEPLYGRLGWVLVPDRSITRTENGADLPLPAGNVMMYYPLARAALPAGDVHLCGNDW